MNPQLSDKKLEVLSSQDSRIGVIPEITDTDIKLEQMQETVDTHTSSEAQKIEELAKITEETSHEKESFRGKYKGRFIGGGILGAGALFWNWMSGSEDKEKEVESKEVQDKKTTNEIAVDHKEQKEGGTSPSSQVVGEKDKSVIESVEDTVTSAKENIDKAQGIFDKVSSFFTKK